MFVSVASFCLSKSAFYRLLVLQIVGFCYEETSKFTEMKCLSIQKSCKCSCNRQQDAVEGNLLLYECVIQSKLQVSRMRWNWL